MASRAVACVLVKREAEILCASEKQEIFVGLDDSWIRICLARSKAEWRRTNREDLEWQIRKSRKLLHDALPELYERKQQNIMKKQKLMIGEGMNSHRKRHHDMICVFMTGVSKTRLERYIRQSIDAETRHKVIPEERTGRKKETEDKVEGWKKM